MSAAVSITDPVRVVDAPDLLIEEVRAQLYRGSFWHPRSPPMPPPCFAHPACPRFAAKRLFAKDLDLDPPFSPAAHIPSPSVLAPPVLWECGEPRPPGGHVGLRLHRLGALRGGVSGPGFRRVCHCPRRYAPRFTEAARLPQRPLSPPSPPHCPHYTCVWPMHPRSHGACSECRDSTNAWPESR